RNSCVPCFDFMSSRCSRTIRPIGNPVRRELFFNQSKSSSVRRMFNARLITHWNTNAAENLFPNIRDRRRIAIALSQRLQSEVVFNGAQHVVMRVVPIEHFGILLTRFLHHISEEKSVDLVCGCAVERLECLYYISYYCL